MITLKINSGARNFNIQASIASEKVNVTYWKKENFHKVRNLTKLVVFLIFFYEEK